MPRIVVLVGPPGSGKSTLARAKYSEFTYINQDKQGKGHMQLFEAALEAGQDIVVDRMGFSKDQRKRYLLPAFGRGYMTEIVVLHQPYRVCRERIFARKDHETIKDEKSARAALSTFFGKYERPTQDEALIVNFVYPEGDKPSAIICDLDGTLCNVDHRLHFVRTETGVRKDWNSFFRNIPGDSVNQWCADILKALAPKHTIIYCSGRPDNWGSETTEWLARHGMFDFPEKPHLFMRPRNDSRDDSIVKEIILDFEILTRFTPYFMIDDRKRVFEMWRSRGFTTLACAKGEF